MQCRDVRAAWHSYTQQQIDDAGREAIEAHLAACDACGELLPFDADLMALLRQRLPASDAPEALRQRVLVAIAKQALEDFGEGSDSVAAAPQTAPAVHATASSWWSRLLASCWTPRLAMAVVVAFLVLVPARALFRAPAVAVEVVRNYQQHCAAAVEAPACCKPLQLHPGDALGDPARQLRVPDLQREGLRFVGASLCHTAGTQMTILVYQSQEDEAFSLYITDRGMENFQALRTRNVGGIQQARHHVGQSEITIWERSGLVWFWVGPRSHTEYTTALADLRTL